MASAGWPWLQAAEISIVMKGVEMQNLFPGHQTSLEVWEEGNKLKQKRQIETEAGEFALSV